MLKSGKGFYLFAVAPDGERYIYRLQWQKKTFIPEGLSWSEKISNLTGTNNTRELAGSVEEEVDPYKDRLRK